jgi:hypothetical protein
LAHVAAQVTWQSEAGLVEQYSLPLQPFSVSHEMVHGPGVLPHRVSPPQVSLQWISQDEASPQLTLLHEFWPSHVIAQGTPGWQTTPVQRPPPLLQATTHLPATHSPAHLPFPVSHPPGTGPVSGGGVMPSAGPGPASGRGSGATS